MNSFESFIELNENDISITTIEESNIISVIRKDMF